MSGCGTVISYEIIALLPLTFCPDLRKIIPMPDISNPKDKSQMAHLPPPSGDSAKAEKYLSQLIKLINQNKLLVNHTDLAQFDPSAIEDHYRMELKQYHVEISHSKQPETGQDFYIMLFTNLQDIRDGCSEKIILAYMHLTQEQFKRFKTTADEQVERRRKEEEEKRFAERFREFLSGKVDLPKVIEKQQRLSSQVFNLLALQTQNRHSLFSPTAILTYIPIV